MYTNKIVAVLLSVFCLQMEVTIAQINMTTYRDMPPLYKLADYDRCLDQGHTYCVVYAEIQNASTDLWHSIDAFSSDSVHHYRHDKLFFGVCLEECRDALHPLDAGRISDLYVGPVQDKEIEGHYIAVHKRDIDLLNIGNNRLIGSCLNYQFRHAYNLTLRTRIEYCENKQMPYKYDSLDYLAWSVFGVLLLLNVLSTLFDHRLKKLSVPNGSFYITPHEGFAHRWLTAFSLKRNWYALLRPPKTPLEEDLKFLEAYRTFGVFIVIFVHCLLFLLSVPVQNPEYFEKLHHQRLSGILRDGSVAIQIFFVISAFLLYVNFVDRQIVTKTTGSLKCFRVYIQIFMYRLFRLLPSMMLLILFHARVMPYLQDGPFWRHLTESERTFCRENWWKNALFLNNLLYKESCAEHTWYLAAETQMFQIFLLVIILVAKYPRLKTPLFAIMLAASVLIPAAVTYKYKLDAIFSSHPEFFRYMFFKNAETYFEAYAPFYTNLSGYLFGVLSADIYIRKVRGRSLDLKGNWKLQFLWALLVPLAFALLFLYTIFAQYNSESSPLLAAFFAGAYRILWMPICCLSILGMCCKLGPIAYTFTCLPVFRVLGKISFQAYLWHIAIILIAVGYIRQPIYLNTLSVSCFILNILVLTLLCSLLMTLFFSIPIANILGVLTQSQRKEIEVENNNKMQKP